MAAASNRVRRARPLLGTFVEIEAAGPASAAVNQAIAVAFERIAAVHRLMSFHDPDSDVSRLNREAFGRPVKVHDWTFRVLEASVELHRQSSGLFDVAVAPVLQSMGLLPRFDEDVLIDGGTDDAIELIEGRLVRFHHRHVKIDLGGIAKGFAVDQALDALCGSGEVDCGLVNAGGDLAAFGAEPQSVHIRHPRDPGHLVGYVQISNEALATTARRFDPFRSVETANSAIIGPGRLPLANAIDGVTVRAASCMIADALTKIVMISGTDATGLLELYRASALVISADGVQISPDWQHAVYLAA
jgi:FAD:protein FMN transferase